MELTEFLERQRLNAAVRVTPYLLRQTNLITGAPVPQAVRPMAPPAPPVVL